MARLATVAPAPAPEERVVATEADSARSRRAEEDAIRREIAERKARVDSLTQALQKLGQPRS
ncbi:MAG: hypothetical protein NVS1B4_17420 [Gemmatimonadaceae bacterium]